MSKKAKGSLADTLVGVRLSQSFWDAQVSDRQTAAEVERDKQAQSNSTRLVINLLANNEQYSKAKFAKGQLYLTYLSYTFPWEDRGGRVMLGTHSMEVMEDLRSAKQMADDAADLFCSDSYPELYEKAVFAAGGNGLGELASRVVGKYPQPDTIREKFANNLTIYPVASADTLRRFGDVFTEQDLEEVMAVELQRTNAAVVDGWKKLAEPLLALADKCNKADDKSRWHSTVTQNIRDVLNRLPAINIANNPEMAEVADKIQAMLHGISVDALKTDTVVRTATRAKADAIIASMQGYL